MMSATDSQLLWAASLDGSDRLRPPGIWSLLWMVITEERVSTKELRLWMTSGDELTTIRLISSASFSHFADDLVSFNSFSRPSFCSLRRQYSSSSSASVTRIARSRVFPGGRLLGIRLVILSVEH